MTEWHDIGPINAFPENEAILIENTPYGTLVVVFQNKEYNVLSGICSHEDYELEGAPVQEDEITCMLHMSSFSLKTGEVLGPPAEENLQIFSTKIEGGNLFISKKVN